MPDASSTWTDGHYYPSIRTLSSDLNLSRHPRLGSALGKVFMKDLGSLMDLATSDNHTTGSNESTYNNLVPTRPSEV